MAYDLDPYRTLGLAQGASLEEVRRAYRRLAKEHHPDAGGADALPRFLAIQAAYEMLVGGSEGSGGAGRGPRRPWQADGTRAEATRRAYGSRTRRPSGGASRPRSQPPPRPPRPPGRERPPNKATPGSTTYDGADEHPFEPGWAGADWYGTTSGTYWTVNPREYADPRKHGPEYQARARRARERATEDDAPEEEAPPEVDPRLGRDAAWWSTDASAHTAGTRGQPSEPSEPAGADRRPPPPPPPPRATDRAGSDPLDPFAAGAGLVRSVVQVSRPRPAVRLGLALFGGVPLALGLSWLFGELTGCARFAATCAVPFEPVSWVVTALTLALLLLIPAAAAVASVGTLVALVAAVPATVFLSVTGGSRLPEASGAALGVVVAIAWLVGAAYAVLARRSARPDPPLS